MFDSCQRFSTVRCQSLTLLLCHHLRASILSEKVINIRMLVNTSSILRTCFQGREVISLADAVVVCPDDASQAFLVHAAALFGIVLLSRRWVSVRVAGVLSLLLTASASRRRLELHFFFLLTAVHSARGRNCGSTLAGLCECAVASRIRRRD